MRVLLYSNHVEEDLPTVVEIQLGRHMGSDVGKWFLSTVGKDSTGFRLAATSAAKHAAGDRDVCLAELEAMLLAADVVLERYP